MQISSEQTAGWLFLYPEKALGTGAIFTVLYSGEAVHLTKQKYTARLELGIYYSIVSKRMQSSRKSFKTQYQLKLEMFCKYPHILEIIVIRKKF